MTQSVTADLVRQLREQTGAGIMACKQALVEAGGEFDRARDVLRTKGLASAEKRKGRETREGLVDSYIHPGGRIGVLLEVNCESDFVAMTDVFKALVHDLALQVANSSPRWVRREDVPAAELDRERAIYQEQALAEGKATDRLEQIVEGRLRKFYETFCLYDQPFLRDEGGKARRVEQVIQEAISTTGENIGVARFTRYQLGERLEADEPDGA
ncbi:MAG TPA: translation elongation factor Ts [Candidatus Nanopelagicaceae bacterium]|nr:translation elongation factor Ts [Candidatus Nanopelagicaceae bacterium]